MYSPVVERMSQSISKKHWWRCNGPRRSRSPFFGWVKRTTNRAPGPYDRWWRLHVYGCGGCFVKVKEPLEYTVKRVRGLFSHDVSLSAVKLTLNDYGFEFLRFNKTVVGTHHKEVATQTPVIPASKTISNSMNVLVSNCPLCTLTIPMGLLTEHLKVCGDVQGIFEDEQGDFSENVFKEGNRNDTAACPMCEKVLVKGFIQEHLEKCDKLQGLFEEDTCDRTEICPFCWVEVKCDDMYAHTLVHEYFIDDSEEEETVTQCLVDDDTDGTDCDSKGSYQNCPFCNFKGNDLENHLSSCLSSFKEVGCDELSSTSTNSEVSAEADANHSCGDATPIKSDTNCPLCGLKVKSYSNGVLECDCLRSSAVAEEFDRSFELETKKVLTFNSRSEVRSKSDSCNKASYPNVLANCESVYSANFPILRSKDVYQRILAFLAKRSPSNDATERSERKDFDIKDNGEDKGGNIIKAKVYKRNLNTLIFCRGCEKFYSTTVCPVCCGNK